jgi:small subunit ribosomal protein S17
MVKKTEIKKVVSSKKTNTTNKRQLKGNIVSDKMELTASVRVTTLKVHPIYKKRYKSYKKYLAHNPENTYKTGDSVLMEETAPKSKNKRWEIIKKLGK